MKIRTFAAIWLLPVLASLGVAIMDRFMAAAGFPVLDGDARFFLPPIISFAQGHGLLSPFNARYDPDGLGRLVHHGFLMQVVLARVFSACNYPHLRLALTAIQGLDLVSYVAMLMISLRRHMTRINVSARLLLALSVASLATSCNVGRPELFAMLLINLAVIAMALLPRGRGQALGGGVFVGMLVVCDPLVGVLAGLVLGLYLCFTQSGRRWFECVGWCSLACVGALLVAFSIYPFGISDWAAGMKYHSAIIFESHGLMKPFYYLVGEPGYSFYGPLFGATLFCGGGYLWRNRHRIQSPVLFSLGMVVLWAVMFKTFLGSFNRYYNLFVFAPLVLTFLLFLVVDRPVPAGARGNRLLSGSVALLFMLSATGCFWLIAMFPAYLMQAISYTEARQALADARAIGAKRICISAGLFTLTEDYRNVTVLLDQSAANECDAVMVLQIDPFKVRPPAIPGFDLTQNRFVSAPVTLFGLHLSASPRGYNYALYLRSKKI